MWWRSFCVLGVLALAGCGFTPLYAAQGESSAIITQLAQIKIHPVKDRMGQQLYNELINRLNPMGYPESPAYVLTTRLTESKSGLGVQRDSSATFAKLRVDARYELRAAQGGTLLYRGKAKAVASYNILESTFATFSAEEDAQSRAVIQIAADMHQSLSLYFKHPVPVLLKKGEDQDG